MSCDFDPRRYFKPITNIAVLVIAVTDICRTDTAFHGPIDLLIVLNRLIEKNFGVIPAIHIIFVLCVTQPPNLVSLFVLQLSIHSLGRQLQNCPKRKCGRQWLQILQSDDCN